MSFDNRYLFHNARYGDGYLRIFPHLSLSEESMREHRLANFGVVIHRPGLSSLDVHGEDVKYQLDRLVDTNTRTFRVLIRMENTPNPRSRMVLANDSDKYGVPRIALNWQINEFDLEYIDRLCDLLGRKIGMAGGRLKVDYNVAKAKRGSGTYQAHHLGTTRMSANPENGVVDANLRCHDVSNLYVTGSSVFPTFGFANPTLTIVALSLRLAEHLRRKAAPDGG